MITGWDMRRLAFLITLFCCALPLLAEDMPRLAVMEMTVDGDIPSLPLRTLLTQELRQLIADKKRFRVLDGAPQQERLAALPDTIPTADRRLCLDHDCLPQLHETLAVDTVLWVTLSCADDTHCFMTAMLHSVTGGTSTAVVVETPPHEEGLHGALRAIAQSLGAPAERTVDILQAAATAKEDYRPLGTTLPESASSHEPRTKPTDRQKLMYQNYIFTLQAFIGTTLGARLTLGTLRWEHFQMEIFSGGAGVDFGTVNLEKTGVYFSLYFLGLGGKWPVTASGRHEIGFIIGILGAGGSFDGDGNRMEYFPTKVAYHYNMIEGAVFEAGISFPLLYFTEVNESYRTYLWGGIPNIQFFVGIGY